MVQQDYFYSASLYEVYCKISVELRFDGGTNVNIESISNLSFTAWFDHS
jgi:hypothetical protein